MARAHRRRHHWLNPNSKELWKDTYRYNTLNQIRNRDMTLGGIKRMVEQLGER